MQQTSNCLSRPALTGMMIFFTIFTPIAWAEEPLRVPNEIEGTTKVTAEGLLDLADSIPELIVIDARVEGDRKRGYIEGSVSLPDTETNCTRLAELIPQKDSPTLFYCNGVHCGRSVKALAIALSCGYSKLYWFRGGFEEWRDKGYPYLTE